MTPLHRACAEGHQKIVQYLLGVSIGSIDLTDAQFMTPLHHACVQGHLEIVQELLSFSDSSVHLPDALSMTPLYHAGAQGHMEIVQQLMGGRANGYRWQEVDQRRLFLPALNNGNLMVFKTILRAFQDANAVHADLCFLQEDQKQHSLVFHAMTKHDPRITKLMVGHEKHW